MSFLLPHLHSGFAVDQAILTVCYYIILWTHFGSLNKAVVALTGRSESCDYPIWSRLG